MWMQTCPQLNQPVLVCSRFTWRRCQLLYSVFWRGRTSPTICSDLHSRLTTAHNFHSSCTIFHPLTCETTFLIHCELWNENLTLYQNIHFWLVWMVIQKYRQVLWSVMWLDFHWREICTMSMALFEKLFALLSTVDDDFTCCFSLSGNNGLIFRWVFSLWGCREAVAVADYEFVIRTSWFWGWTQWYTIHFVVMCIIMYISRPCVLSGFICVSQCSQEVMLSDWLIHVIL